MLISIINSQQQFLEDWSLGNLLTTVMEKNDTKNFKISWGDNSYFYNNRTKWAIADWKKKLTRDAKRSAEISRNRQLLFALTIYIIVLSFTCNRESYIYNYNLGFQALPTFRNYIFLRQLKFSMIYTNS